MFVPEKPDLVGKIQTRTDRGETVNYKDVGEAALWEHDGKYVLRGNVQIGNEKYLVSFEWNPKKEFPPEPQAEVTA